MVVILGIVVVAIAAVLVIETVMLDEALQELDATRTELAQARADVAALKAALQAELEIDEQEIRSRCSEMSKAKADWYARESIRGKRLRKALAASHQQQPGASPAAVAPPRAAVDDRRWAVEWVEDHPEVRTLRCRHSGCLGPPICRCCNSLMVEMAMPNDLDDDIVPTSDQPQATGDESDGE